MKHLLIAASLALSACATIGGPETPGQKLYAAYGAYGVALAAAADYKETPQADPTIVATLRRVNREAMPAVQFGKAYIACKGSNAAVVPGFDCRFWNFQPGSVASYATTLRSVATALLIRGN